MSKEKHADCVIINGEIYIGDGRKIDNGGIAIKNGKIIFVGKSAGVNKYIGPRTNIINAEGRTILPGFIDSHIHLVAYGVTLDYIDLNHVESIAEIKNSVAREIKRRGRGRWIIGRGWDQEKLREGRYPNRYDLDEAAPENPVLLIRVCGHIAVVNSLALKQADISRDTPDPPGGVIERDDKGEPTGILKERAIDLIREKLPQPTIDGYIEAAKRAIQRCLENGVTTVHMMSALPQEVVALKKLFNIEELRLRIRIYLDHRYYKELYDELGEELNNDWIRINGIKIIADGSLGGRTAALREPYADNPGNSGELIMNPLELREIVEGAIKKGMQLAIHGIGDRAIETILNTLEDIGGEMDVSDLRVRLEHCSIMPPDLIEKARRLNIIISVQPSFIGADFWILDRLGEERIKYVYNYSTLIRNGLRVCAGSDAPVAQVDTLRDIYLAVTRGGNDNMIAKYTPEESLTMGEAIKIYTYNGAYACFDEEKTGSIEPRKYADIVIFDKRVESIQDLREARVWMTLVNGEIKYKSD